MRQFSPPIHKSVRSTTAAIGAIGGMSAPGDVSEVTKAAAAAILSLLISSSALAQEIVRFDYPGFVSLVGSTAYGSAASVLSSDGTVMRFSDCGQTLASGALRVNDRIPVGTFSMELSWRIACPGGTTDLAGQAGGDGFLVTFSPADAPYPSGDWSRFISIPGWALQIFFDTHQNAGELGTNMIRVIQSGAPPAPVSTVSVPGRFDDGARWYSWIAYDGQNIEVRVAQSPVRPIVAQLVQPMNSALRFGGCDATVAISAFVGTANGRHDLISWRMASAPAASSGPSSQSVCSGSDITFKVAANGAGPFTYLWTKGGIPIDTIANPSAATATLSLTNVSATDVASYDCVVTNSCGSITSNSATLSICYADFNCDAVVEDGDFVVFAAAYDLLLCDDPAMPANCPADLNRDGLVEDSDFVLFASAYDALVCS